MTRNMTMINLKEPSEIIRSTTKKKRWTAFEKQQIINETYQPGVSVSFVARRHGIPPSQLFHWRKIMEMGGLTAMTKEEQVVPISKVKELEKRVRDLERLLGRQTLHNEILKEAVKLAQEKKLISRQPLPGLDDFDSEL